MVNKDRPIAPWTIGFNFF